MEYTTPQLTEFYLSVAFEALEVSSWYETIDLVTARDGKQIAFEIEPGKSDVEANVRKCGEAGFDRVVLVKTK